MSLKYFLKQNNENIEKLNSFIDYLKNKDNFNSEHKNINLNIDEWQVYDGIYKDYKPLFEGIGYLFGVEQFLGVLPDNASVNDYCAGVFIIQTKDICIGFSLYIGQGSELRAVVWNLDSPKDEIWKVCKKYSIDELIYIAERHISELKQSNNNINRELDKEYPLHHEEHEIISTPIIPGKKKMTPEEYEDRINELLSRIKVLQETIDRQNIEISEMKGKLCL